MALHVQLRFARKVLARNSSEIASSARPYFPQSIGKVLQRLRDLWLGHPSARFRIAKVRRYSGSGFSGCLWTTRSWAKFTTLNATSGWSRPKRVSL